MATTRERLRTVIVEGNGEIARLVAERIATLVRERRAQGKRLVLGLATGSTPIQNIRDNYPDVETTEFDTYSQCVEALINDQVDAVTTDQAILIGYAAQNPDELQVVGEPFTEERYGIGLPKGDDALREHINTLLEENPDIWQAIYDNNLGDSGVEGTQPEVDRY